MTFAATVLYVDDLGASMRFYQSALGFELRFHDPAYEYAELTRDGAVLALGTHSLGEKMMPGYQRPADGKVSSVEIAFFTADVRAAFEKGIAAGGTPVAAPKLMPWGMTVAYARAVDGTIIGLSTPPPAGSENPDSATPVSVEEYLRTSYRPDVDYVDGVIEERNVGEFDHS